MTVLAFLGLGDSGTVKGQSLGEDDYLAKTDELLTNQGNLTTVSAAEASASITFPSEVYLRFKGQSSSTASTMLDAVVDCDGDLCVDYIPTQDLFDNIKFWAKLDDITTLKRVPVESVVLDSDGEVRVKILTKAYDLPLVLKASMFVEVPHGYTHTEWTGFFYMDNDMVLKVYEAEGWVPVTFAHDGAFTQGKLYWLR